MSVIKKYKTSKMSVCIIFFFPLSSIFIFSFFLKGEVKDQRVSCFNSILQRGVGLCASVGFRFYFEFKLVHSFYVSNFSSPQFYLFINIFILFLLLLFLFYFLLLFYFFVLFILFIYFFLQFNGQNQTQK